MAKTKNDEQNKSTDYKNAPIGILTRVRDFYVNTLCDCSGRVNQSSIINCTIPAQTPHLPRNHDVGSSKEVDNEDLQDLMRLLSTRKRGGAKVDVDSEGNLVWKKPAAEASYGGGVGRIGRIDEDRPCSFSEVDVNKFWHSKCGSNNNETNRRNVGYC